MIAAFLHVDFSGVRQENRPAHHEQRQADLIACVCVEALRLAMPDAEIVQLADESTPAVGGCRVIRREWTHDNPMVFRMEHLADLEGDVLSIDTDCIVQADVSGVFGLPFDVALTFRDKPVIDPKTGVDLQKIMPFNTGVCFTRNNAFWKECLKALPQKNLGWYADQLVISRVAGRFNVLKLHSDNFNYTPMIAGEDVRRRMIVHYKGKWRHHIVDNPLMEAA